MAIRRRLLVSARALAAAGCIAPRSFPPPSGTLLDAALEVGREMGLTEAHVDREESLLVWRFRPEAWDPVTGPGCTGPFTWHVEQVQDAVALFDPLIFFDCPGDPTRFPVEGSRLQEEFERRWLARVGPVRLIGPGPQTHSTDVPGRMWRRLMGAGLDPSGSPPR